MHLGKKPAMGILAFVVFALIRIEQSRTIGTGVGLFERPKDVVAGRSELRPAA